MQEATWRYSGDPKMRGRASGLPSLGLASEKAAVASCSACLYLGWTTYVVGIPLCQGYWCYSIVRGASSSLRPNNA